ncbi:MAG: TonB-dependent receptor, partial [Gemmatimonadales bacterium]
GFNDLGDYAKFVPSLSFGTREPGGTSIVFRGIAAAGIQYGAVSSSGLYLDEQPITVAGVNPVPRLVDIERLEALRGPQGTLYGASSMSGTLRIITNKPDAAEFDAWVDASLSQVDDGDTGYDVSGMVNLPLVPDRLALRLVGFAAEEAGFIDNVFAESQGGTFDNAGLVEEDVDSVDYVGGRAGLRWQISDRWTADLSAIFQNRDGDGFSDVNLDVGDLEQVRFGEESFEDEWYQLALTLNAELPFADAVIATSYFDRDFRYDADATDYEFSFNESGYVSYDFGGDPRGNAINDQNDEFTTIEARLTSRADSNSRWSWIAGVFYSEYNRTSTFDSFVQGYENTPAFAYFSYLQYYYTGSFLEPTERWFLGVYDDELKQTAVFGEISFDLTENFTITAGGRWFDYEREFAQRQESPEGSTAFNFLDDVAKSDDNDFSAKLNLTYRINDDRLVYATYSEGFRVGGANPLKERSVLPRSYDPDEVTNYEVGAKTDWFENRLRFNIAAYYMEWDDIQVQVEDPQALIFQLGYVNFPSAENLGFEVEFAVLPSERWLIEGAVARNDAEISETARRFGCRVEDGARLPLTPDWTASAGIEYRPSMRMFGAEPFARFDYAYVGDSVNSVGCESVVGGTGVDTQDSYDTGDLRIGLETESWSGAFFVENLWDERGEVFISNRWAKQRVSVIRPRTFGINLRYRF